LISERLHGKRRERNVSDAVRSLGVRYPNDGVSEVHLVPLHRDQFLVDPETSFRDDPNDIPQVLRSVMLDPFLLRPTDIVWPKQTLNRHRELDA
jgi:hypothetical protein